MEKNFNDMTMKELKKLQDLLTTEIHKRGEKEKKDAKQKIYMLLNEIGKICEDNNFNLRVLDYDDDYELFIPDIYIS